jgi:hypothetical protein
LKHRSSQVNLVPDSVRLTRQQLKQAQLDFKNLNEIFDQYQDQKAKNEEPETLKKLESARKPSQTSKLIEEGVRSGSSSHSKVRSMKIITQSSSRHEKETSGSTDLIREGDRVFVQDSSDMTEERLKEMLENLKKTLETYLDNSQTVTKAVSDSMLVKRK